LAERLEILISLPDRQKIEEELDKETRTEIKRQQEEYYLTQRIKMIERRLRKSGDYDSGEMSKFLERLEKEPYPEHVKKVVYKEAKRYEKMHPSSNEAYIIMQYVD